MSEASNKNLTLQELIGEVRNHLEELKYTKETLRHFNQCWSVLNSYAKSENVITFTTEFGHRFLLEKYDIKPFEKLTSSYKRSLRRSVTILADYQQMGIIYKRQPTRLHEWPEQYHDICEIFLDKIVRNRLAKGTQRHYRLHLERFTNYLIENDIKNIEFVMARNIDGYFSTYIGYQKRSIAYACYVLKTFFKFALENGYIHNDLVVFIPVICVCQ